MWHNPTIHAQDECKRIAEGMRGRIVEQLQVYVAEINKL